jgi:signal transduction histidine kinase/Tfp pilus assembly protein PilF
MIRKITLLLPFFFLFSITQVQSQSTNYKTIDSLKLELKKTNNNSKKTDLLLSLSSYTGYIDSDESLNYAKEALTYAKKNKNVINIADAYANLGVAYEVKSDFVSALNNLYKALAIYETSSDPKKIIRVYNNIGLIYIDLKNYKQGLVFYNKALELSYKTNEKRIISLLSNNIGDVYLQQKEYSKALNYFYKALIMNKKLNDIEGIGLNLSNIGICYVNLKNYDKGLEMINQSILTYDDYSSLYNTYNIYELGRIYYFKSLEEAYKNNKKENIEKSIKYLNQTLINFKKYKSLKDIQETYFYLSKANKIKGNKDLALDYFEKYSTIKDSIFSKDSEKKLANLEFQRELDIKNKQIEIQKLKINRDSRKVYFLIIVTISVVLLFGLFLWLYLSKRKTNKIISDINTQKDKFFSIIAHDLRGPFNGFLGLTELMAEDIDTLSTEDIKFAAVNMKSSAQNLFNLLENLLEWSRMEQNLIPFDPKELELQSILSDSIVILYDSAYKKDISINTDIENVKIVFADKNMFQAIIRNIVFNAIKFTPKNGVINIQTKEDVTNTIITVIDNGIGMSPKIVENLFKLDIQNNRIGTEEEPSTGLGLILCKEYIEKHNGKIWIESNVGKGTAFHISFPKNTMK